jgi:phytoene dehydrogenase-like protein
MNIVVIGAGADELVAARLLSRHGNQVLVIEDPASKGAEGWVPQKVADALGIALTVTHPDPWMRARLPDGGTLDLWQDPARSVESIRRLSQRDAAKWPQFTERMANVARLLERFYLQAPPGLVDFRFAVGVRLLGRRGMEDLMRWLAMPVAELLDEWFESDILKGALGAMALRDVHAGPREAGTAFALLHRHVGCAPGVFRAARTDFMERLRLPVKEGRARQILVRGGRVAGVALDGGEELAAALVVSGAGARRTLTELVEPGWLDPDLVRAARHIRARRVSAFVALGEAEVTHAPSLDYLQRAYDEAKYGRGRPAAEAASAELALDQALWMRPLPVLARYETPIQGLWLSGQDMHPGAGVAGAAGYNCAQRIVSTLRA